MAIINNWRSNRMVLYALCQGIGWVLFVTYELSFYSRRFEFDRKVIENGLLNIVLGITITHIYRALTHRWGWHALPLRQLLPLVVAATVAMVLVFVAVNIPLDAYYWPYLKDVDNKFLVYFGNWFKYILLWTSFYHVFHFAEKSAQAEAERLKTEISLKESQFQNLKTQLNPHFLFNALNSIKALTLDRPHDARVAITHLSDLLRSTLSSGHMRLVPLKQELQTVRDYLEMEKIRYGDRLQVKCDVEEQLLEAMVPPLSWLTLVENAVKHGTAKRISASTLQISANELEGNRMEVSCISPGMITKPWNPEAEYKGGGDGGLGLHLTYKRLQQIFNGDASLNLEQESNSNVKASIVIPLTYKKDEGNNNR